MFRSTDGHTCNLYRSTVVYGEVFGRLVLTHGLGLSVLIRIQQGRVMDAVPPPFTWPAAHDTPAISRTAV